ncbi:LOW QUALITY PROTEIN: transcription repressor OFP14-like [Chenopodium quinoa]|uniref:LOW QUALITY PROTEIN: transcription repressor OFP14-like n=1 Tax=Chenopodium quinoa TaxID=63459 RepID=UPI000B78CD4D|nr:LOW QUALITY PROTEIN: transcription repressor OFP14-like [Chenopodium quinoa]
MSKKLQKSLQDYLSKIKKQTPHLQFSHSSLSSTTRKIVAGCKHPKSLSFTGKDRRKNHHDQQQHDEEVATAATLEDIDNFLIENFKSLYGQGHDNHIDDGYESTNEGKNGKNTLQEYQLNQIEDTIGNHEGLGRLYESPRFFTPPRDLCGSQRFFFTSSSSSSLVEEARISGQGGPSSSSEDEESPLTPKRDTQTHPQNYIKDGTSAIPGGIEDCIALLTVSPSPYEDFRKSMQQVLDAKVNNQERVDWDFMEELLFCYLRLNEKKQYRYILSAFVDLIVVLRQNSSIRGPEGSRN